MRFDQSIFSAAGISVIVFCWSFAASALAEDSTLYDWLIAGKVSGFHVRLIRDDGTRVTDFEFNDRGRGPRLHEELKTGPDGMLLSLQVRGWSLLLGE